MPYSSRAFQWYQEDNKGQCGLGDLLNPQTNKQSNYLTNYLPSIDLLLGLVWFPQVWTLKFLILIVLIIEFPMTNIIQNSIVVAPAPHSQAVLVA
jgi:hypothetical protein